MCGVVYQRETSLDFIMLSIYFRKIPKSFSAASQALHPQLLFPHTHTHTHTNTRPQTHTNIHTYISPRKAPPPYSHKDQKRFSHTRSQCPVSRHTSCQTQPLCQS